MFQAYKVKFAGELNKAVDQTFEKIGV